MMGKGLALLVVIFVASAAGSAGLHPLSDEYIALTNQKAKTWIAGRNFKVQEWEKLKRIASGVLPYNPPYKKSYKANPHNEDEVVPENFDAREAWPKCDSLKQIADQSSCGSCWALSATGAMSDRICILSNQTKQVYVSAENLLSCCYGMDVCGVGCDGGFIREPFEYWQTTGIVTGGLYNSSEGCQDYSMPPCEHFGDTGVRPKCQDKSYPTPACSKVCYDTSLDYNNSLTFGGEVRTFDYEPKQMQLEIMKNGPISASFWVYEDFFNYKSGVYQCTSDEPVGRHSVKILGWGVENDVPYWLCANSWNNDWGDGGFFKILRGENQCEIESIVAAGLATL